MTFTEFCKANDIHLLRDDLSYLRLHIGYLPENERKRVLKRYCNEWLKGMREESNIALKQNMGRREANKFIRELTDEL